MASQNKQKKNIKEEGIKLTPEEKALLRTEALHSNIDLEIKHISPKGEKGDKCDLNPDDYIEAEMGYELMAGEDACNEIESER